MAKCNINWFNFTRSVPISDKLKNEWIEKAIAHLDKNPDSHMYYITSGDTMILITREEDSGHYSIHDLKPRRHGLCRSQNSNSGTCNCDTQIIISKGCQCGGS